MKIIPWHCHICGNTFDTPNGGLCSRCNKATCRSCLILSSADNQSENKERTGYVCTQCATPEELKHAPFFILRKISKAVIILLIFGFFIDLFSGFYVLKQSKSIYAGLAALLIVAIFYIIGEAGSEWIGGKDDVAHPLYKRASRLLVLLLFAGLILAVTWLIMKFFGMLRM